MTRHTYSYVCVLIYCTRRVLYLLLYEYSTRKLVYLEEFCGGTRDVDTCDGGLARQPPARRPEAPPGKPIRARRRAPTREQPDAASAHTVQTGARESARPTRLRAGHSKRHRRRIERALHRHSSCHIAVHVLQNINSQFQTEQSRFLEFRTNTLSIFFRILQLHAPTDLLLCERSVSQESL